MENKIRALLSMLGIALFLVFAFASELLDESTNTSVEGVECHARPQVSGVLKVTVKVVDEDNEPIPFLIGKLFIKEQIVLDSVVCTYFPNNGVVIPFELGPGGTYTYTSQTSFTHQNTADLFRVELYMPKDLDKDFQELRQVEITTYDGNSIVFDHLEDQSL